jgi:anti-sigma regulatory factor (Ser/Thr protein kinase)
VDQQKPGQADPDADVAQLHAASRSPVELRLKVPATSTEIADIRRSVRTAARKHGITEPLLGDISLAVTEACANVVAHAYRDAPHPGPLTVEVYRERRDFVVTVCDAGTGIAPRADSGGLGLGLALIARMTRRMEIVRNELNGSTVLMAFAVTEA